MNSFPKIKDEDQEKYSSAVSLSDMEIFIFPELLYSLVLANIMSPIIWEWKKHEWFSKIDTMKPYKKIQRLKQFIIDNYEFNLDLDTWGLTTKEDEMKRFSSFIDEATLSQSNALFGYEGDKHYFTLDIRKHFGLDKYTSSTIPYWKTETVEAMDAFRLKENYRVGAGECVSLSTLYAAALFIICDIPLEDIFLIATPLHSQNFINIKDGILTNNRRLVTKNMWFNGSDLSAKAQRALRNEKVTIVSNNSGYIHTYYKDATINPDDLDIFCESLHTFTTTDITYEILGNFLRERTEFQKCFQIKYLRHGKEQFLPIELAYSYEHGSPYKVSEQSTCEKLLDQIDEYEFFVNPIKERIQLTKLSDYLKNNPISYSDKESLKDLAEKIDCCESMVTKITIIEALIDFIHLKPSLPNKSEKTFNNTSPILLKPKMQREEIISIISEIRDTNPVADLAFYASRDLKVTDWRPFITSAMERNPVAIEATDKLTDDELTETIKYLSNDSIYNSSRVAQPDEVWNFQCGDGVEKAITLASIWRQRYPKSSLNLICNKNEIILNIDKIAHLFTSNKEFIKEISL